MGKILSGYTVLITGGTRGIGAEIAKRLREEGASVNVTGTTLGGNAPDGCMYHQAKFDVKENLDNFITKVKKMKVDILINNAGINKIGCFEELNYSDFCRIQNVNVHAPFLLCQAVIPWMKRNKWGRIVNISSIFGKISKEYRASYSSSKFALDGMTTSLAAEVASYGILANCISPGFIDTELTRNILGEDGIKELVSTVPIGRLGMPKEIAAFVFWLSSPENSFISGQNISIDGGFTRV